MTDDFSPGRVSFDVGLTVSASSFFSFTSEVGRGSSLEITVRDIRP